MSTKLHKKDTEEIKLLQLDSDDTAAPVFNTTVYHGFLLVSNCELSTKETEFTC